jgi:hypothetical protein
VNTAFSRGASAALLILLCTAPLASAQSLAGVVVDPQRKIIVGARVTVACGGEPAVLETDAQGRFMFLRTAGDDCGLTVTHPGFVPFEQTLTVAQKTLTVQLRLADIKYAITVSPGTADRPTLETVSIPDTVLGTISNTTRDLIDYARSVAGAASGDMRVYVDGLPARTLPSADAVRSVTINADPFSAEFAEGDETRVDIATKAPDRTLHFGFSGGSLGLGGRSVLGSGLRSASRSYNGFVSAAIPRLPLTFSISGRRGIDEHEEPVQAAVPSIARLGPLSPVPVRTSVGSGSFRVDYFQSADTHASVTYDQGATKASNLGAGGLNLSDAGLQLHGRVQEFRGTFVKSASLFVYESGLAINRASSTLSANSAERGIEVVGDFISGGALITRQATHESTWMFRNVVQTSAFNQIWRYGATVSGSRNVADLQPNRAGSITFSDSTAYAAALAGAPTGTQVLLTGSGRVDNSDRMAAAFIQSERDLGTGTIAGGLRGDYQTRGKLLLSPRISATTRLGRFITRSGAGLFVTPWPDTLFLQVRENDGSTVQRFVVPGSTLNSVAGPPAAGAGSVTSVLAPDFAPARSWMASGSIERQIGPVAAAVQYTWIDRSHVNGSRRFASGDRWIDVMESNRAARKHQVHALLRAGTDTRNVLAHYIWTRSQDNTDGPFSYTERTDDLEREWARSSGTSPHGVIVVGSLGTIGGLAMTVVATLNGAAPYDITTGTDSDGNGLFNERGGRARNAGNGPDFRSIDVHASRTLPIPGRFIGLTDPLKLNAGLQAENLLGSRNYATVDSIAGTRLFGAPLTGLAGRSLRIWLNWAR